MQSYEPEHPKPYEFIEFAATEPQRQEAVGHDAVRSQALTGKFELYLIVRSPVQVANGRTDVRKTDQGQEIVAQDTRVKKYKQNGTDTRQTMVLPGSSLKGMMRSLLETIAPCCVATVARKTNRAIPHGLARCSETTKLCPACRLFGMVGSGNQNYLGQIHVEDAELVKGEEVIVRTPLLWTPARSGAGLPPSYIEGNQAKGRKVYHPSLPAGGPDARIALKIGSMLLTTIHFENLQPAELGLLIAALGFHPGYRFLPKIGAGKPVGMGSVETYINSVEVVGDIRQSGRLGSGAIKYSEDALQAKIAEWTQAASQAEGLLNEDRLHALADMLRLSNLKRPPIEGIY